MLLREINDRVQLSSSFLIELDDNPLERALGQLGANWHHSAGGHGGGVRSQKDVDPSMEPVILEIIKNAETGQNIDEQHLLRLVPSGSERKAAAEELKDALSLIRSTREIFATKIKENSDVLGAIGGNFGQWESDNPKDKLLSRDPGEAVIREKIIGKYSQKFKTLLMDRTGGAKLINTWVGLAADMLKMEDGAATSDKEAKKEAVRGFCRQLSGALHMLEDSTAKAANMLSKDNNADASA
jgi:hypothetical protein